MKIGFRGERKGILTPSLSQGEGECSDGKGGECGDGKAEETSPSPFQRGNVVTEKRKRN